MLKRVTVNVFPFVKSRLKEVQKHVGLKNESETTAYLLEFYNMFYEKLTVSQQEKILDVVKDIHSQGDLLG